MKAAGDSRSLFFMSMDDQPLIIPAKGKGDPDLPPCGLLCVNPYEVQIARQLSMEKGGKRYNLFNSEVLVGDRKGGFFFVAGPAVGAPMAVMCLEKLIALGAEKIVHMSWCGAINPALAKDDIVIPDLAVSEEGTSQHYNPPDIIQSNPSLRKELLEYFKQRDISLKTGKIWTTDAPYRETRSKIEYYADIGIAGVDMEYAALCAVSAFRHKQLASVMIVSDELYHVRWQPGFNRKAFRKISRQCLELLCDFCMSMNLRDE